MILIKSDDVMPKRLVTKIITLNLFNFTQTTYDENVMRNIRDGLQFHANASNIKFHSAMAFYTSNRDYAAEQRNR